MARSVIFSGDIHGAILRGVDKVADAARLTLGPRARDSGEGLAVAKDVQLSDPIERIGAQMLREVATRTARVVGDGTATATVLASAIYREGAKRVRTGADPLEVRRGIQMAVQSALAALDRLARPVEGENVARVAALLAGNDEEIGSLLAAAIGGAGAEGPITVEEAKGPESAVELVRRTWLDANLLSSYFAGDSGRVETVFEHPKVLLCDRELGAAKELLPVLRRVARQGRPLLVVARDVQDEALFTLIANRLHGILEVAAIMAPGSGARRTAGLRDLAALTGARVLSGRSGPVRWEDLGKARRAVHGEFHTTIFTDAQDAESCKAVARRLRQLRSRLASASPEHEKGALQQRLVQVEGTLVTLVQVGGATAAERKRRRARVETALDAMRAAIREGIVPGGGLALLRAIPALADLEAAGDVQTGIDVVRRALEEPARRIAENAGRKGSATVRRLLATEGSIGYNAVTGRYEDLIAAGVVDPLKVTRTALLTATSIAAATLTAESMMSERKVLAAAVDRAAGIPIYGAPDGGGGGGYFPPGQSVRRDPAPASTPPGRQVQRAVKPREQQQPIKVSESPEPPHKKINIGIDERKHNPSEPLHIGKLYTLSFNVGKKVEASLARGPQTLVPLEDIPWNGLETTWTVISESVELRPVSEGVRVISELVGSSSRWRAIFSLRIPRQGESLVVRLGIMPLPKAEARLQVLVSAYGELYRQLEIVLHVEMSDPLPGDQSVVSAANEVIHKFPGELGLRPSRAWERPPGSVTITVTQMGSHVQGKAPVKGETWETWEPNEFISWPPRNATLAVPIQQVRSAADAFRERWQDYLNYIPAGDFLRRLPFDRDGLRYFGLSSGSTLPRDWNRLLDSADATHRQRWDEVAASQELHTLAFHGYKLYQALFPRGSELRSRLDALRPGVRLNINWLDSSGGPWIPHVPWGLMYTENPSDEHPVDALKFLGLRYRIAYVPYQVETPKGALGNPEEVHIAHCLYWGEDDPPGHEARWQWERWKHLDKQVNIPGETSGKEAKMRLRELLRSPHPQPMVVLYFFCRSAQGSSPADLVLRFANSSQEHDTLGPMDIGVNPLPDRPLVFANACATAAAEDAYIANELERTFIKDRGCRAFVGTEAKVPVVLASRFATAFFHFFYRHVDPEKPVSAGEAVAQARLFLWTQYRNLGGLFYCLVNKYDLFLADEQEVLKLGA